MINIKKKLSILVIPVALMVAMIFFTIIPTISEIKEISENIKERRETLELKSSPTQNIKKNLNKLNEIKKTSKTYSSFVAKGEELNLIESLEKIADKHFIKQDIDIGTPTKEEELPISIILEGDYISLLKYLTSTEKEEYYINIQSLTFNALDKKIITTGLLGDEFQRSNLIKLSIKASAFLR